MGVLGQVYRIAIRECGNLRSHPVYFFCMIVFPAIVILFFTSMMHEGLPVELPVGVVDLDNTSTTRSLIRRLDGFQTSHVAGSYTNLNEARAMRSTLSCIFPRVRPMICCLPANREFPFITLIRRSRQARCSSET